MEHCTKKPGGDKEIPAYTADAIETRMRERIRETIQALVEEELEAVLGAERSARVGEARQGYRHGARERTLTTSLGPTTIAMPRARSVARSASSTVVVWVNRVTSSVHRRSRCACSTEPGGMTACACQIGCSGGSLRVAPPICTACRARRCCGSADSADWWAVKRT